MENVVKLQRKNLDLPVDVWRKLGALAALQGTSLKSFAERLLAAKAAQVEVVVNDNPSPSGDIWWENPENVAKVDRAIRQNEAGEGDVKTLDEIKEFLGL